MKELVVKISGHSAGLLKQSSSGNLTFQYHPDYLGTETPLSLSLPPRAESYQKGDLMPFLQGLLPDNEAALRAIASRYSVSPQNPFAILQHIGADVAGAVEFLPSDHREQPEQSRALSELEVANLLREKIAEYTTGQPGVTAGLFSLAGAQPKLALNKTSSGHWRTGTRSVPTTHILKPLPVQLPDLDIAELMTMETAHQLGLSVAKAEFAQFDSIRVLVVKRFDRNVVSGAVSKIHQEDFLQAMGISPYKKYQKTEGGPGLKKIAQLFRLIPATSRSDIAEQFFRALAFNIIIQATDAHAKNYSLLLAGQEVSMAPLYDLISGAGIAGATESAMAIGGKYRFSEISDEALAREGSMLGVADPLLLVQDLRTRLDQAVKNAESAVREQLPRALRPALKDLAEKMRLLA